MQDVGTTTREAPTEGCLGGAVLDHIDRSVEGAVLSRVLWDGAHSTEVFELRFTDGRSLMVKRARHGWARARFAASKRAAALLRERTDIVAPTPIDLPEDLDERPLQAYWRIDHPTLGAVWNDLAVEDRRSAMRSLGSLLDRLHGVRVEGWGRLEEEVGTGGADLREFLESDIGERLLPAARGMWPRAVRSLEALRERIPELSQRIGPRPATLVHNDIHTGNVLCTLRPDGSERIRCIGLLDLDSAVSVPAESDAASLEVLHGPHFEQHLPKPLRDRVWRGYGRTLDPWALVFFRALHLSNLGFYSALVEHHEHAGRVVEALTAEVDRLSDVDRPSERDRHAEALGSVV